MLLRYIAPLCATQALAVIAQPPIVEDGGVTNIGTYSDGVESFHNIRYGQDTAGQRRFKPPVPFSYGPGFRVNATQAGAACPQVLGNPLPQFHGIYGNVTKISEDCLTVRVTRPLNTSAHAKLPVMVYLYGSGYEFGSIYDEVAYNPVNFVKLDESKGLPVIYVAINYRVGIFGFAASDPLRDEGSLNVGLLDQYLGLQWVRDHIESFGGNPKDVTLFGQNVGWANIQLQLTAFGGNSESLFNRAILQSGPTISGVGLTAGITDNSTAQVTRAVNCTSQNGQEELSCLRALPMDTLNKAAIEYADTFSSLGGFGTFRPTAPSAFIPDVPSVLLHNGSFRKDVDILIGWNENDGSIFVPPNTNGTEGFNATIKALFPGLSNISFHNLTELYPASNFSDDAEGGTDRNFFRASQVVRDAYFACPSLRLAREWHDFAPNRSVYMYTLNQSIFSHREANTHRSFYGVSHFSDIPYVFDAVSNADWSAAADQSDYDIGSYMSGSWASFATFGQPTVPSVSDEELVAHNLTFSNWTQAGWIQEAGLGMQIRILGGPRNGMTWTFGGYDEIFDWRCAFWGGEDVLRQMWT
ncbi:carboxylesterase family protein [Hypoxylon sp. FL0890]|nr:carboxylesterase family protein [Hypoxylon sp. FL0890]